MKGSPDSGGPLTSEPAWMNTQGCSTTPVFFCLTESLVPRDYAGASVVRRAHLRAAALRGYMLRLRLLEGEPGIDALKP